MFHYRFAWIWLNSRGLYRGAMKKLAWAETPKVGKKQIIIVKVVGKPVCSEARPNEPAFKRNAIYNGETPGFSLTNRKCSDYYGNAEQV